MSETSFRFGNRDIWQRAAGLGHPLFVLADKPDKRRYYRFAEQLRAAVLSIANNIAEGSGSASVAAFANFLNPARRSVFEVANLLILFERQGYLRPTETSPILAELAEQYRMIFAFRRTLKA